MESFTSLRIFVRVVELGSFAAAAREADISSTMVGKHIQTLEDGLKARLLHRTTRRHSLTDIGQLYYERAKALLHDWQTLQRSADELRTEVIGQLKVAAPVTFGNHALVPALQAFQAQYPAVRVQLMLNDRVVDLLEEGFDVAFRIGPIHSEGLVARPLAPYRMLLAASPAYLEKNVAPQMPIDLAAHHCLSFSPWSHHKRWRLVHAQGQQQTVEVQGRLLINHGEGLRQAALAGMGIVAQPAMLLADDIEAGRLVRVLPEWAPPPRPMHLVSPPDRRATATVSRFIAFAMQRFGADT